MTKKPDPGYFYFNFSKIIYNITERERLNITRRIGMKSFYHFLMKYRQPKISDDITAFANNAYEDHSFPKHSSSYHEISNYLEMNGHYIDSMSVFDKAWDLYIQYEGELTT
jgi:uncharacterized protein YozE (UPF0346 family)